MRTGITNQTYRVLGVDDDLTIVDDDSATIDIDQFEGEEVEIWKEREDGFLFVYCNRMEIGYWVMPSHITVNRVTR